MGTVNQLLALADSQVGQTSGERYWDAYRRRHNAGIGAYVNGDRTPYCAAFDTWLLDETGTKCAHFPSLVAFDWSDVGDEGINKYDLRPGDMVAFDWDGDRGGDHVGVVREVCGWGVVTVEGNTGGGRVMRQNRYWSQIICGVRPAYEEDEMTSAEWQKLEKMLDSKIEAALGRVGGKVWSFKNSKLEKVDAYQILRDVRTSIGVNDGQKLNEYCVTFAQGVVAKVCAALGIKL